MQPFRATVGPAELYYEVAGTGDPLVLLHGLSGSGRWWRRNVDALARRHRVYALDLVGFGRSRCAHPFTLHEAAEMIARWMTHVIGEPAHIAGHSMGGFIAADLAARHPERVRRLILVDAAAHPFDLACLPGPLGALRGLAAARPGFLPLLIQDAALAGPQTIARAAYELFTADIRERLGEIRAPTLVVWGEHDLLVPLRLGQIIAARISDARLAIFPNTGHNPMFDRPEAFNRLALEFLGGVPADHTAPQLPIQRSAAVVS